MFTNILKKRKEILLWFTHPHFITNLSSFMEEDDTLSLSFYIHFHCMKYHWKYMVTEAVILANISHCIPQGGKKNHQHYSE